MARTMIDTLDALPALTSSWIASLKCTDPELYAELAETLVIGVPGTASGRHFPAGITTTIEALDLSGKQIGAFHFAPAEGPDAAIQILNYDKMVRDRYDAPPGLVFIGDYGAGNAFAAPQGIGLFDPESGLIDLVARDFETFLILQANAYDSYKRHIVKAGDETSYNSERDFIARNPRFLEENVVAVFAAQIRG